MDTSKKVVDAKQMMTLFIKKKSCICRSALGIIFITMGVIFFLIDPISITTRYITRLSKNSLMYSRLQETLEGVTIEIYLFNITNSKEFVSGVDNKLKLQEVGPFVYTQKRKHKNISIDEETHTLRYTPSAMNSFDPSRSVGDPNKVYLNLPNIALLLAASKVATRFPLMKFAFYLMTSRFHNSPILNISVQEYLWGYEDPIITAGNTLIPGVFHFSKLGLLDRFFDPKQYLPLELDATDDNKFQIKRLDGEGGLKGLGYTEKRSRCNSFNDTYEGIVFPYKLSPDRPVRLYHNIYCRMLDLEVFRNETMEYGSEAMVYRIKKDAFQHIPENECVCPSRRCLNGVSDLSPCFYDLPLGLSLAHFLDGEEKLFERIDGLEPNETLHGSEIYVDREVGLSLACQFSIQYNLMVGDVSFISALKSFSDLVVPFVWIKVVQPPLPDDLIFQLRLVNVYAPVTLLVVETLLLLGGVAVLVHVYVRAHNSKCKQTSKMEYPQCHSEKNVNIIDVQLPLIENDKYVIINKCDNV